MKEQPTTESVRPEAVEPNVIPYLRATMPNDPMIVAEAAAAPKAPSYTPRPEK